VIRWMIISCMGLMLAMPQQVQSAEISLGAGGVAMSSEYRGVSAQAYPMPLVSWDDERFYVKGLGAGLYLWKSDACKLSGGLEYLPAHFRPHDSDNVAMKRLDKRYSSMLAFAAWEYSSKDWGSLRIKVAADVLDNSGGFLADISYSKQLEFGPVVLTPAAGVRWTSSEYNDYYYGVSTGESQKSGLAAYEADGGFSPFANVRVDVALSPHWGLYAIASAMLLSEEIRDSSMVDEDVRFGIGGGISYTF